MMVEMPDPFVWPEVPKDLSPWDKETFDAAQEDRKEMESVFRPDIRQKPSKERVSMAEQARELLELREGWKGEKREEDGEVWEDVGEAVEVETDVQIPRERQ